MLKQTRQQIINHLWEKYRDGSTQVKLIADHLQQQQINQLFLDHFAVIDLPGPNTGISHLRKLFATLGFIDRGHDYLPEKQNEFAWMTEEDSVGATAETVLPQVVIADFRPAEMPPEIQKIIEKYALQAAALPIAQLEQLAYKTAHGDQHAANHLRQLALQYLHGRDWALPTVKEFQAVQAFNELLAWVLVFGRKPNHFTLSIHLLKHYQSLTDFHRFITDDLCLPLNQDGGAIKGSRLIGMEQGSTAGVQQVVALADGQVKLATDFVEFVWRYPHTELNRNACFWDDYFTGFIAQHANRVIESLYQAE